MGKKASIGMRISEELKAELQALADADKRSLSQYAEIVLEQHVESLRAGKPASVEEKRQRKR